MFKNDINSIILCVILLLTLISFVLRLMESVHRKRQDDHLSLLIFSLIRKQKTLDDDYMLLKEQNQEYEKEIKHLQEMINSLGVLETKNSNTISSLTSSINKYMEEYKRIKDEKIYPTPQLSEMIRQTIGEYVLQEVTLLKHQRVIISPDGPISAAISDKVCKTYPHVNEEWICKKVIEFIQEKSTQ